MIEMVQVLGRMNYEDLASSDFPSSALTANPVFYRTYSRKRSSDGLRESWRQVFRRTIDGLRSISDLSDDELDLIAEQQSSLKCLPSGRWLWVGGTDWIQHKLNFSGAYNCTSTKIVDWKAFGLMMDLAMMGCGTGAILESHHVEKLPPICNKLIVSVTALGGRSRGDRVERTWIKTDNDQVSIVVGDSRSGWVDSYQMLLELASEPSFKGTVYVTVNLTNVRPAGERLAGFGGTANPVKLPEMYAKCAEILNEAVGRKLTPIECCLLIDEAAACVVAGNIRRSAGIRQGSSNDTVFAAAKDNLWTQENGEWKIDPKRDALRMANHTRVFHVRPTKTECLEAVRSQFYSGEGAIQYAPEAIARSNADLLTCDHLHHGFIDAYEKSRSTAAAMLMELNPSMPEDELEHRLGRYGLNPCGEIIGEDFHCNLSEVHLNLIDPNDFEAQADAFRAGALMVSVLLHHKFAEPRYQKSRELDPIVGVSFTGLFDFFVAAFGVEWLQWWAVGRPQTDEGNAFRMREQEYLVNWRMIVEETVREYCARNGLRCPNRCTTVQPAGTKSLLTGASAGWHPPKAQRFIRRITFAKNDPVAKACLDLGYSIIPSQSDKDADGNLLNDPFDPGCTEWLVEMPIEVAWANLPGADEIEIEAFSAAAQFDFYAQVQTHYSRHNTSATIELREDEVEELTDCIYRSINSYGGYISAALLARFDAPFPRMPFEKIDKETYLKLCREVDDRRQTDDFAAALGLHDLADLTDSGTQGPAGCDSDKCMMPERAR